MTSNLDIVTGGAGFIGSHLTAALLERGRRVRIIDNLATGDIQRISGLLEDHGDRCTFLEEDLRDIDALRKAMSGAEVVYHQGAVPSVPRSVADPLTSNSANVGGTLNVFLAAHEAGVRKVVYASSSSVYGNTRELPKHEGLPLAPLSPYAVTKCAGEMYGRVFSELFGLSTIGLRYFNVFGPSQDPNSTYAAVIPRFITRMLNGEAPIIYGDGEQSRDFTFIDNVVEANVRAASSDASGISVNIACGQRFTLNELVAALNRILATEIEPQYEAARSGDVRDSQANIQLAAQSIGYQVQLGFEEGLERTVEWFRRR